jgi:filamentous hemagglutinin family protein
VVILTTITTRHKGESMRSKNTLLTLVGGLALLAYGMAQADVITDGTVGAAANVSGPNYQIDASLGTQAGGNLFHSFSEFSVASGESATFNGPASVNNIISRVTGGSASQIDGTLRSTIQNANLYLINPRGILFGKDAQLDVPGSLYVSTADQIGFADGNTFSTNSNSADVLTVAAPAAFGFLTTSPGNIQINAENLAAATGESLNFIGGDIDINIDAVGRAGINADSGDINLVSSAGSNQVNLIDGRSELGDQAGSTISLGGNARLETNTSNNLNAGAIHIQANTLTVAGQTKIESDTRGSGNAGNITIQVNRLNMLEDADLSTSSFSSGNAGLIDIQADQINLSDQVFISSTTFLDSGDGGEVNIQASTSIQMTEDATISTVAHVDTTGDAGNINITTPYLLIVGKGETDGDGDAAEDSALIASNTLSGSTGFGGNITINSDQIQMGNGATIAVRSQGTGNAGNIVINGNDRLEANQSFISAESVHADGGNINIDTRLVVLDSSHISADSAGASGGRLNIQSTLVRTPDSTTTARGVAQAQDGEVLIRDEINPDQALLDLKLNFFDDEVKEPCSVVVVEEGVVLNVRKAKCYR